MDQRQNGSLQHARSTQVRIRITCFCFPGKGRAFVIAALAGFATGVLRAMTYAPRPSPIRFRLPAHRPAGRAAQLHSERDAASAFVLIGDLTLTPVAGAVPEPELYAMFAAGFGHARLHRAQETLIARRLAKTY